MNLTKPFFETVLNTYNVWREDYYQQSNTPPVRNTFQAFFLYNETGQKIRYWLSDSEVVSHLFLQHILTQFKGEL